VYLPRYFIAQKCVQEQGLRAVRQALAALAALAASAAASAASAAAAAVLAVLAALAVLAVLAVTAPAALAAAALAALAVTAPAALAALAAPTASPNPSGTSPRNRARANGALNSMGTLTRMASVASTPSMVLCARIRRWAMAGPMPGIFSV
jgi:hypothetical protein